MRKYNILPKLKPMIEMPFGDKYALAQVIIERQLREHLGKIAVAWSGGKDSTIVLYLVIKKEPRIPVVFNNTGIEYPQTIDFIREITREWKLNLIESRPIKTFWQCVDEYGWPQGKTNHKNGHNDKCCYYLKERPAKLIYRQLGTEMVFDGITAIENRNRQIHAQKYGTCYFSKHSGYSVSHPILYWTDDDVWNFVKSEQIPMNSIYYSPYEAERCGCSCCTAFLTWETQLNKCNPKLYKMVKLRRDKQYSFSGV